MTDTPQALRQRLGWRGETLPVGLLLITAVWDGRSRSCTPPSPIASTPLMSDPR